MRTRGPTPCMTSGESFKTSSAIVAQTMPETASSACFSVGDASFATRSRMTVHTLDAERAGEAAILRAMTVTVWLPASLKRGLFMGDRGQEVFRGETARI